MIGYDEAENNFEHSKNGLFLSKEYLNAITEIVRCPITGDKLRLMSATEIEDINKKIENEIIAGFIGDTGKYIYPIYNGIAILLPNEAIITDATKSKSVLMDKNKAIVKEFYDDFGWKEENGLTKDALLFEDLRPISQAYIEKCDKRVSRYIKSNGKYFLDVASGPIQKPQYLEYSRNYEYRVCVDISITALKGARKKLGNKGIYILGDITNLPFLDNSFDAVVSLHTIYHVPRNEQKKAFMEIFRLLKNNSSAAIVYSHGRNCNVMRILSYPLFLLTVLNKVRTAIIKPKIDSPKLYFYAHGYKWLRDNLSTLGSIYIYIWRSVNVPFLKTYIHKGIWGKQILDMIYKLEEKFPKFLGRFGQYPLIVITKDI